MPTVDGPAGRVRAAPHDGGATWAALGGAILGLALWYAVVMLARPTLVADEVYHVPAIRALAHEVPPLRELARNDWGPLRNLQMLPAYHLLASLVTRVWGAELWVLRGFNALLAILALVLFHAAARAYHVDYGPHHLLRFAWNPLLLPLWVLVYTDLAALVGILVALNFHVRRRYVAAAVGLLLACLIRQSNVIWVLFFLVWGLGEWWRARRIIRQETGDAGPAPACGFPSAAHVAGLLPYLVLLLLAAGYTALSGGLAETLREENRPRANVAQFYIFALTAALLWAPVWLPQLVRLWPRRIEPALVRPWICAAVVTVIGVLDLAFRNPHPWNLDLDYLRNWPLYWMTTHAAARYAAATVLVLFVPTLVWATWVSPARETLGLLWAFSVLFLLGHYLVDPRYYVVPFVLADFFTPLAAAPARRLTVWYLLLALAVSAFIVGQPGGWHGVL
jgi:hypothetical protein